MKKQLEFKIQDNKYLLVEDTTFSLKRIDAIFVANSSEAEGYAILIQYGRELIELYYNTKDELEIVNQFKKLAKEIISLQPDFNFAGSTALINYNNVKQIDFIDGALKTKIIAKFDNSKLVRKGGSKKQYDNMLRDYKTAQFKSKAEL